MSILNRLLNKFFEDKQRKIIWRLWVISSAHLTYGILACLCLVASSAANLYSPFIMGNIANILMTPDAEEFNKKIYSSFFMLIVISLSGMLNRIFIELFTMSFIKQMRLNYYRSLLEKDIEFYDLKKTNDLFVLLTGEMEDLRNTTFVELGRIVEHTVKFIGSIVGMFFISVKLSLLLMMIMPFIILVLYYSDGERRKQFHSIHSHKKASHNIALESLENIRIVKTFSTEEKEIKKYDDKLNMMFNVEYNMLMKTTLFDGASFGIFLIGVLIAVRVGYNLVKQESITTGDITSFALLAKNLFESFFTFGQFSRRIAKSLFIAEKLFDIIDYVPKIKLKEKGIEKRLIGDIEFKNVDFVYPAKKDAQVLKKFSLAIKKGESIGIVGTSGSGKSTILSLVERLYEFTGDGAAINIDGVDIRKLDIKFTHQQIGYVSQEPSLFNGTILENIVYGVKEYTQDDLMDVISKSRCEFILNKEMFPKGLQTNVGEKGAQLSGGQKQRIAIARALIKKPKVLILDEATSALDSESEFQFQKELSKYKGEITIITVAHRLSTIKDCDKIVVINKGIIAEMGKHEELLSLNGIYKHLMERQMDME